MKQVNGVLAVTLLGVLALARPAAAQTNAWDRGASWLTLRAGYAKSSVEGSGNGGAGYGFGYSHMLHPLKFWRWTLFNQYAIGGYVHHELLGKQAAASEIEIPATLELVRHMDWHSTFHPYLGVGAGPMYRKTYRTGQDARTVELGTYLTLGGNVSVAPMQMLGVDVRIIRVDAVNSPANPVFGAGSGELAVENGQTVFKSKKGTHWSVKLGYSRAY